MNDKKETKINWSNLAFALGGFGITSGAGFAVTAMTKADKTTQLAGATIPAIGAGIIAYFARKTCPPCVKPSIQPVAPTTRLLPSGRETPRQSTLIGYNTIIPNIPSGTIQSRTFVNAPLVTDLQWVPAAKHALEKLGYYHKTHNEENINQYTEGTNPEFHNAVAEFQQDMNLTPTGWIDNQTAAKLSEATGETIATITPQGVGLPLDNPSVKKEKTNWALWLGLGAGALILGGVIIYSAKKK